MTETDTKFNGNNLLLDKSENQLNISNNIIVPSIQEEIIVTTTTNITTSSSVKVINNNYIDNIIGKRNNNDDNSNNIHIEHNLSNNTITNTNNNVNSIIYQQHLDVIKPELEPHQVPGASENGTTTPPDWLKSLFGSGSTLCNKTLVPINIHLFGIHSHDDNENTTSEKSLFNVGVVPLEAEGQRTINFSISRFFIFVTNTENPNGEISYYMYRETNQDCGTFNVLPKHILEVIKTFKSTEDFNQFVRSHFNNNKPITTVQSDQFLIKDDDN